MTDITENKTPISDTSFEALITDPTFILKDFKAVCVKNDIDFVGLMNQMGFTADTFKALLVNKSITEQIYVLSRELQIVIYRMGVASECSTLNARSMLGSPLDSKDWLAMLDTVLFPYMAVCDKEGKLDPEWFIKNDVKSEEEQMADTVSEYMKANSELTQEFEQGVNDTAALFDEDGNLKDEAVEDILEDSEEVAVTQGDEDVVKVPLNDAEEAIEEVKDVVEGFDVERNPEASESN